MHPTVSLSRKLVRIGTALLLVALASISLTLWVTWQLEGGAAAVNEAGRMRMQTWRLASSVQAGVERAELQALVAGDKFDKARAQTLVSEKTAAIQARSPEVIAALADFYDSLNPAQQQKVREFMQQRGRWFHRG